MVGWHHWLNGHEFEQAPGICNGQGGLACCSPWGCKESDMTEQLNRTEPSLNDLYLNDFSQNKFMILDKYFFFLFCCEPAYKLLQSCPTLCDPMKYSPPDSSAHGILQARVLGWVAISYSRRSSQPRDQTRVSCIAGGFITVWATFAV